MAQSQDPRKAKGRVTMSFLDAVRLEKAEVQQLLADTFCPTLGHLEPLFRPSRSRSPGAR